VHALRTGIHEPAPQRGLPALTGISEAAFFPVENHLGPENQILIERLGDLSGQLIPFRRIIFFAQIAGDIAKFLFPDQPGQHFPKRPGHDGGVKIRIGSIAGYERGEDFFQKFAGKRKAVIGRNAVEFSQLKQNPLGHPRALHHDGLSRERFFRGRLRQPVGQAADKFFQIVADDDFHD